MTNDTLNRYSGYDDMSEREKDIYMTAYERGLRDAATEVNKRARSEISDYHRGFNDGLKGANKRDEAMKLESQEPALWEQKAKELLATNEKLSQAYDALKREMVDVPQRECLADFVMGPGTSPKVGISDKVKRVTEKLLKDIEVEK